jgi:adenylosuccinate synthase
VTKLDVLDTFPEIPVAVAYELDGRRLEEMPSEVDVLNRVQPVYETLPGWQRSTEGARSLADLPAEARAYLERVESLAGAPIRYVSVGTHREQIIAV